MKTATTICAAALFALATASGVALAADASAVAATPATTDATQSAPAAKKPTTAKKVKPHSHVQEKVGVAPAAATPGAGPDKATIDKMHQHPKDGK